jgi:hypothetical protein
MVIASADRTWVVVVADEIPAVHVIDKSVRIIVNSVAGDFPCVGEQIAGQVFMGKIKAIVHNPDNRGRSAGREIPRQSSIGVCVDRSAIRSRVSVMPLAGEQGIVRDGFIPFINGPKVRMGEYDQVTLLIPVRYSQCVGRRGVHDSQQKLVPYKRFAPDNGYSVRCIECVNLILPDVRSELGNEFVGENRWVVISVHLDHEPGIPEEIRAPLSNGANELKNFGTIRTLPEPENEHAA